MIKPKQLEALRGDLYISSALTSSDVPSRSLSLGGAFLPHTLSLDQ